MRQLVPGVVVILLLAAALPGCGPAVPRDELGTVVYEIPKVEGADKPYQLPPEAGPPQDPKRHGRQTP